METLLDLDALLALLAEAEAWARENLFILGTAIQFVVIGAAFVFARLSAAPAVRWIDHVTQAPGLERFVPVLRRILFPLMLPAIWLIVQWLSVGAASRVGWPHHLIESAVSLLAAWIVIRLAANFVRDPWWSRALALTAWTVAALNILGLLDPTLRILDDLAIQLGDFRLSLLGVIKGAIALTLLLWLASSASRFLEHRIGAVANLSPSVRVLLGKLARILLVILACVIALESVGIDLTALAVFSGAVGLGIGFGLQKVISNFISGIILLMDRSVKPGDVIAVGGTYGWINALSARYVSVVTRDGVEHLIPNEELIGQQVENWSFSNPRVRQRLPFGVAYGSDIHRAIALAEEAAGECDRVLAEPAPSCLLTGFGDSAVDLELRIWIQDAEQGLANVKSEIYIRIWDLFHEHGIAFPFPQRDIHIKSAPAGGLGGVGEG